ncbi:MAG TPA: DMT family transporter [Kofleriaceae bacterium]|jgi:drug/metabolite transporter (DMT)-like permease|nr:DMT family transporter [Kofleriaceae bacterium]
MPAVVAAYLTCALVWGTTWYAVRASTGPGGFPTLEAAALRFVLATLILAPIVVALRLGPWPRDRRTWIWMGVAGVLDAVSYALVYYGEERIPGGLAAVLFSTQPLMLAVLLRATGYERVRIADVVGALVALVGVGVIFADRWDVSPTQVVGLVMLLGAVAASTSYSVILKRHGPEVHPVVVTLIFLAVTAVALVIAAAVRGIEVPAWPPPERATFALVYLAVMGSVVAFATWLWLLRRLPLMVSGTLVFVLPVIALVVDAIWEHQLRLGGRAYLGIAIVLGGLAVSLAGKRATA